MQRPSLSTTRNRIFKSALMLVSFIVLVGVTSAQAQQETFEPSMGLAPYVILRAPQTRPWDARPHHRKKMVSAWQQVEADTTTKPEVNSEETEIPRPLFEPASPIEFDSIAKHRLQAIPSSSKVTLSPSEPPPAMERVARPTHEPPRKRAGVIAIMSQYRRQHQRSGAAMKNDGDLESGVPNSNTSREGVLNDLPNSREVGDLMWMPSNAAVDGVTMGEDYYPAWPSDELARTQRPQYFTYRVPYSYGWFGAHAEKTRARSFGYNRTRTQWTFQ